MAGFDDIVRSAMQGLGITPPDPGYQLPATPADAPQQDGSPVSDSAYGPYAQQELRMATPLDNEIKPGMMATTRQMKADPISRFVNSATGQFTDEGQKIANDATENALSFGPGSIKAYHGSPHMFDRFDMNKIGTGEGAQAYSRGLYFAENEAVAKEYRDSLSDFVPHPAYADEHYRLTSMINELKNSVRSADEDAQMAYTDFGPQSSQYAETQQHLNNIYNALHDYQEQLFAVPGKKGGHMYEVNLNVEPEQLLDWDKRIKDQSPIIRSAADQLGLAPQNVGSNAYEDLLANIRRNEGINAPEMYKVAVDKLLGAGVPGLRYLDNWSRSSGQGSHNVVMYNDALIDILRRYGIAGMAGGGAAALATQGGQPEQ